MIQSPFTDAKYAGKRKKALREHVLIKNGQAVIWDGLITLSKSHYLKAGCGYPAYPLITCGGPLMQNDFSVGGAPMGELLHTATRLRQHTELSPYRATKHQFNCTRLSSRSLQKIQPNKWYCSHFCDLWIVQKLLQGMGKVYLQHGLTAMKRSIYWVFT